MRTTLIHRVLLLTLVHFTCIEGVCQESVFQGLKSDLKKADEYFNHQRFHQALDLYLVVSDGKHAPPDIALKIARTYDQLRDNANAAKWYAQYISEAGSLPRQDQLRYAEVLSGSGKYKEAIEAYGQVQLGKDDEEAIRAKVWRLKNIQYLYEDSAYYSLKPVSFTTNASEFGPAYYEEGIVFVSNRTSKRGIQRLDGTTNAPFQNLFYAASYVDTTTNKILFSTPTDFARGLEAKFHKGTLALFPDQNKMIYTKSVEGTNGSPGVLQLFFAERHDDSWTDVGAFPYNSLQYSASHPSLSADGQTLYFVSDMPGGHGAKDLYRSEFENNAWTKPQNLGSSVNTQGDETFPFCHGSDVLYFASDGRGGFGGLDIFRINLTGDDEPQNMGYPVNTNFDDFGIILDADGTGGFFCSNRRRGSVDDDIYAIAIGLQPYPLTITGDVRFKTSEADEPTLPMALSNAYLSLVDIEANRAVADTYTDSAGVFSLQIPYPGQFKIEVVEKTIGKKMVSLQLSKTRKAHNHHQIVIIKDRLDEAAGGDLSEPLPTREK